MGARGSGSVGATRTGQSGFAPCLAKSDLGSLYTFLGIGLVSRSGASTISAWGRAHCRQSSGGRSVVWRNDVHCFVRICLEERKVFYARLPSSCLGGKIVRRRYGGMETGCRRVDVEVWSSGAQELWRCAASVAFLSREIWSCGGVRGCRDV